jgi:hypothetical protein
MKKVNLNDVTQYVEQNIGTFHQKRISGLNDLKLNKVLGKKNPYLFKAKYILTAQDIIKSLTDAFISSQEETIFGDWLEGLAIFINEKVFNGRKSGIPGIDIEFDKDGIRYIITIKSGPNWGNSSQTAKMVADFKTAKKTLRTSNSQLNITAVNGCCYGRDNNPDKGDYFKYCGQKFWEFVSDDAELFTKIIEPLGHQAKEWNDDFIISYSQMINKFTKEFADTFCMENGSIDWDKLVRFNSAIILPTK